MLNTKALSEFAKKDAERLELQKKVDKLTKELAEEMPSLLENLAQEGVDQVKLDGRTVYIQRQIWAKFDDKDAAIAALKDSGLTEYVYETFNSNSLSAFLRECEDEDRNLPKEFSGIIESNEVYKLRTRKAG